MGNETAKDITNMIEIGYVNHKTYGWDVHFYEFYVDILKFNGLDIAYIANQDRPGFILESHCIDFPCSMHLKSMLVCSEIMCDYILEKYDKQLLEAYVTEKLKTYLIKEYNVEIDESFYFSVNTTMQKVELFEPLIITQPSFFQKYFLGFIIVGITFVIILFMPLCQNWNAQRKRKNLEHRISNALVLNVTIGKYQKSENDRLNEIDEEMQDLEGIEHDFDHIQDLFAHRLQYEMYPKLNENEYKMIWNEQQLKMFLEEKAWDLSQNIDSGKKYDGLILVISSHGIPDYIVTSDYKLYSKLAIQRTFSFYPILRIIPRFILFDTVQKKKEENEAEDEDDIEQDDEKQIEEIDQFESTNDVIDAIDGKEEENDEMAQDIDKRVDVIDIFEGDNKPKWGLNEKNPDHLVGRVDSVNMGFVNRLDRRFGSLCVYMFYQKYLAILDAKKREIPFTHQIFEEIQEELQLEKKQPPECKWNDSTQYIVFKKNKKIAQ